MPRANRIDDERLELLLLARLGCATKPLGRSRLEQSLARFVEPLVEGSQWSALAEKKLASLEKRGEVELAPLRATEKGVRRVCKALGVGKLPPWKRTCNVLLPTLALGRKEPVGSADSLRAAILQQRQQKPSGRAGSVVAVLDTLVWEALGANGERPLSMNAVRAHVLRELVGEVRKPSSASLARIAAARIAGAPRTDADSLRAQLLCGWLSAQPAATAQPKSKSHPDPKCPVIEDFSLEAFAARVRDAARQERAGRYGDRKVFISAVWRTLQGEALFDHMTIDEFKAQLIRANQQGLLHLHRADLVGAMDQNEVEQSEATYLNATFHFIESEWRSA